MANTRQTVKRIRQNESKRQRQQGQVAATRTAMKRFEKAVKNNEDNSEELYRNAVSMLDQAAGKGLIHKNKAAREKSRLAGKLSQ